MTTPTLAANTGVAYVTLLAMKESDQTPNIEPWGIASIRRLLEARGAEFFNQLDGRPDVRLKACGKPRRASRE